MQHTRLDATFSALADPTRRAILARLATGEASVGELAKPFDLTLPTVSRHLKVLEQAALIVRIKDAQWRRCRLRPEPLAEAAEWIAHHRAFWEQSLDGLAHFLAAGPAQEPAKSRARGRRRRKKND